MDRLRNAGYKTSNSWFLLMEEVLLMYSLTALGELKTLQLKDHIWKSQTKKAVLQYWAEDAKVQASTYSSLRFLALI
jgi:hypothetical protein